jgi:uncharacterized protein YxeA
LLKRSTLRKSKKPEVRKMKKILATILALVLAIGVTTMAWATETAAEKVAKVGETEYATLQEAVNAADGKTVQLLQDVTASITIESGKTVTLDLNGKTLTNTDGQHTITNNGTLTITATNGGTVDNVSHARAALFNNEGATAVLNGGSFTRSQESGKTKEDSGNNSFYTIQNLGTMTINAGVSVTQNGCFSSMVANGYYNGTGKTNTPTMIINGGTFSGGLNTVKNDDCGVMTINGGKFKNFAQACVQNHNKLTITNGNFDGSELKAIADSTVSVIYNCGCGADNDKGMLSISGGTFSGGEEETYVICDVSTVSEAYTDISGGTFTKGSATMIGKTASAKVAISGGAFKDAAGKAVDVSAYLAAGKQQNSDGSVGNKSYYYYPSTSDTTTSTTTKGSPKTFDAGVGIYAVTAVLSVTGMAWTAKKRH